MSKLLTQRVKNVKKRFFFKNEKTLKKRLIKSVADKYTQLFKANKKDLE